MADFTGASDGGDVATDSIWAAAGDIAYATSDDTATVLSVGCNNDILQLACGVPSWVTDLTFSGDLKVGGGCITLGCSKILSGGDTTSLNLIDAIDATTETTFECAIDALSNLVEVGALDAGSITSGFGTINNGTSAITTSGLITGGTFSTGNSGTAKFLDGNGSHYFTLAAHATTTASVAYTWPAADGDCGQALTTNSSGELSWATAGGGRCVSGTTDNGIVTWVNSGSTFAVEAATYSGSDLQLPAAGQFLAGTGSACNPGYSFRGDLNLGMYRAGADQLAWGICCGEAMRLEGGGKLYLNESANGDLGKGITINQGAVDNYIIAFKSSDVCHGITCWAETDTYFGLKKNCASRGGAYLQTFVATGTADGFYFLAGVTDDNQTKSTSGRAAITFDVRKKSGSTLGAMATDSNIVKISTEDTTRFLFDKEGTAHSDVEFDDASFDDYCDIELVRGFMGAVLPKYQTRFGKEVLYGREWYEGHKLLGKDSVHQEQRECGKWVTRAMVNFTGLTMLHHSTIIQMHDNLQAIIQSQEQRISQLENQLALGSK